MIPGFAGGQDKPLIEAARKEGKVTIFGSLQDEVMKEIQTSFEKKYPGVKSVYWRASTTAVMDRAISEFRTGNVSWDVFFTGVDAMEIMRNEGMFLRYQTAASKNFDKSYHHEFYSPNYRSSIIGLVYNTRSIKPAEAPKSYWDYVDPKWDGKTTMSDPTSHTSMAKWLSSLHLVLGDKGKEDEYTHRLAASRPLLHRSLTPAVESIANGEKPLGIAYIKYVCDMLEAAEAMANAGFRPRRTIYFAFGHDEETSGTAGAKSIAALLASRGVHLDFVIDEGLLITEGIMLAERFRQGIAEPRPPDIEGMAERAQRVADPARRRGLLVQNDQNRQQGG